jgi:tetratricopeptide (TPR) repeat protein
MRADSWRTILGVATSVTVPATMLSALAGSERRTLGLPVSPFGTTQLLIVHLVAAVPLGYIVAREVWPSVRRLGPVLQLGVGLLLAVAVAALGPSIGRALDAIDAGFVMRTFCRSALAVFLVTPWLVPPRRASRASRPAFVAGLFLAVLPPLAFAHRLAEVRTTEAASYLETGRLVRAEAVIEGLSEIGSWYPINDKSPRQARQSTQASLEALRGEARRAPSEDASVSSRFQRAFLLFQLDQLEEADKLLRPLAEIDTTAALLLASLDRDRGRWADCERTYRRVLGPSGSMDPRHLVAAYDGLAGVLRAAGRPGDATALYHQASQRLSDPGHAGYFALQRGRHELEAGRPFAALSALSDAVRLNPSLGPQADTFLRQVRLKTPACLLAHPKK